MVSNLKPKVTEALSKAPLFNKYLGPLLLKRLERPDWYENRFLRDLLKDSSFLQEHECLFQSADLQDVGSAEAIFSDLGGDSLDFDMQLFDALAEVRLVCWARSDGYSSMRGLGVLLSAGLRGRDKPAWNRPELVLIHQ